MANEWMRLVELDISIETFRQLPRNSAYKYEYFGGKAWLNPRPKYYHALLDLEPLRQGVLEGIDREMVVRPMRADDWGRLGSVFAAAFHRQQPFSGLPDEQRLEAALASLERTKEGGDGPWIEEASFVATRGEQDHPLGAALVTLLPLADLTDWDGCHWQEPPPPDCIARRLGRPHLTWIFVVPLFTGHGVGTALLAAVVSRLLAMGFSELASTFLLGNDSSMLWHWRNGFRLLAYPGSRRKAL